MITSSPEYVSPAEAGLIPARWERLLHVAEELCRCGDLPALAIEVQHHGKSPAPITFGSRLLDSSEPLKADALFLTASLTKPLIAMAVLLLVEQGRLTLGDRVCDWLPEFRGADRRKITIRHLLTHTSGLPDMLPDNEALRKTNAPLSRFVAEICRTPLISPPGRAAQYQSMGYALLGPIIEHVSGQPYQQFLREHLCEPVGMLHTWLGLPDDSDILQQVVEVRIPAEQADGADWNWNSPYWRHFGAPWGGAYSTVSDLSRFCRAMLTGCDSRGNQLFSMATLQEATTNRLPDFAALPEVERRTRSWGYGWRMNWKDHRATFCDLLPANAFGHWGATGTLMWIDRDRELAAVLLSSEPHQSNATALIRLSNLIVAAVEGQPSRAG